MMHGINRRNWCKGMAAAAVGAGLSTLRPPAAFSAENGPATEESEAMGALAQKFMEEYAVPGLSIAIALHGQLVWEEGFGFADKANGERLTPAHLFRIASVSKPVTSVAVHSLIEQGKVKADDLVFGPGGVLESDFGTSAREFEQGLTVHHLLTHTGGGWTNDGSDPMFHNPEFAHHELIAWTLENQPMKSAPGEHFAYSNFGYCILGRAVEKLSGQPYETFVRENILSKCDVREMRIGGNTLAERFPNEVVYVGNKGSNPYGMKVRRMDSHGGWLAKASDLVRLAMHVDGFETTPNILQAATVKSMTTPTGANPSYASGWSVNKAPNWWHGGSIPGTTSILVRTASGLCWAALANARADGIDLALDQLMWRIAKAVPSWKA